MNIGTSQVDYSFKRSISSCFEDFLHIYIDDQDKYDNFSLYYYYYYYYLYKKLIIYWIMFDV